MKESQWELIEFGKHNYDVLISEAGAKPPTEEEDRSFVSFVKSLQIVKTSFIDWGHGRLLNYISVETADRFIDCDEYLVAMFRDLGVRLDDVMIVGWRDQWESIEIGVGEALKYAPQMIFVGQGMVALGKDRHWIVEYASDRRLYGATILPDNKVL